MKVLLFLIVLSFSHIISANQKGTNLVELNNMRATVALKRKPDGSFCQLDVRGNSKLTPSFVKSAHRKASAPKSNAPICSESDIKAFQKGAKKLNLKGAKGQKTSVGALLGTLAKSAGVGCVFGAGISWVADMWKGNSNDEKTEAGSSCIDCANQKSKEEKEVKGLKTTAIGVAGGAVLGTGIGLIDGALYSAENLDVVREVEYETIVKKNLSDALNSKKVQSKLILIESEIGQAKLHSVIGKENVAAYMNLKADEMRNQLKSSNANSKKLNYLERQKKFWSKIANLHKKGATNSQVEAFVREKARIRANMIPESKLIQELTYKDKLGREQKRQIIIEQRKLSTDQYKKELATKWGKLVSGIVGGVAGAIVCEDGTTYLLSEEKIEDI